MISLSILVISVLAAYGAAVLLVEKGNDGPVEPIKRNLGLLVGMIHPKAYNVFECTICLSFWTALVMDVALFFLSEQQYFLWPISGFIASGLAWTVYEILNAIDPVLEEDISDEPQ